MGPAVAPATPRPGSRVVVLCAPTLSDLPLPDPASPAAASAAAVPPAGAPGEVARALRDAGRLGALAATGLLDPAADDPLARVARLAAQALGTPVAQVNLVTADRQVPVAAYVAPAVTAADPGALDRWREPVTLAASLCQYVVASGAPAALGDAREDAVARASEAVTRAGLVGYVSVPLRAPAAPGAAPGTGPVVGSVCVVDTAPRRWTAADVAALEDLAVVAAAEVARRTVERHRRALADAMPQIVWTAAPDGRLEFLNRRWAEVTGQDPADAVLGDAGPAAFVHPDDQAGVLAVWRRRLPGGDLEGQDFTFEYRLRTAGGAYRWHLGRVTTEREEQGDGRPRRVVRWVGTATDVDDQRRAAQALEEANALLQEQQVELELANQQLQDQAAELELQAEALAERTRELEAALAAVAAGERRFAAVQAATPDGVVLARAVREARADGAPGEVVDYVYTYVNPAGAALLGRAPEELVGGRMLALYPHIAEVRDAAGRPVLDAYREVLATGTPYRTEFSYRAPEYTGTIRLTVVRKSGALAPTPGTADDGLAFNYADVTDRVLAERRTRQLLEVTAALSSAATPRDVARAVTERLVAVLDLTAASLSVMVPGADGDAVQVLGAYGYDPALVAAWRTFPAAAPVPVAEVLRTGEPLYFASLDEVDARYPALDARRHMRDTPASAVVPLVVRDGGAEGGRRVIGALGLSYGTECAFDPAVRELFGALAQQTALALDRARSYAAEQAARAEAERERAAAEAARARAEQEAARAVEASQAKSVFLATMSHELRTPLNAIGGYTQLLDMGLHGPVSAPQREVLGRVARAQQHLLGLINDVLNYARLESGRVEYDVRAVDVREVLADVAPLVEPQARAKGLRLDVRLPDGPCLVWADREKLGQVLVNLLSNAVKFTEPPAPAAGAGRPDVVLDVAGGGAPNGAPGGPPNEAPDGLPDDTPGGAVAVDLGRRAAPGGAGGPDPDAVVFLRVCDTGRGIPRDQQDRIFEPFVQVRPPGAGSTYARAVEGTGLGLAISRDLARGMGGDLRVRSAAGAGSTFTVTLRRVVTADGRAADRRTRDERRAVERRDAADRRADAATAVDDADPADGPAAEGDA